MRLVKSNVNIDFMGKRKLAVGLSTLAVIVALVALPTFGLNFGPAPPVVALSRGTLEPDESPLGQTNPLKER